NRSWDKISRVIRNVASPRDQRRLHSAHRSLAAPFTLPTVPGSLHFGRARHGPTAKTLFAFRFRLKLGLAPFRFGLDSAKRFVRSLRCTPPANIQTEADSS